MRASDLHRDRPRRVVHAVREGRPSGGLVPDGDAPDSVGESHEDFGDAGGEGVLGVVDNGQVLFPRQVVPPNIAPVELHELVVARQDDELGKPLEALTVEHGVDHTERIRELRTVYLRREVDIDVRLEGERPPPVGHKLSVHLLHEGRNDGDEGRDTGDVHAGRARRCSLGTRAKGEGHAGGGGVVGTEGRG